jgi:hypothetical protein
MGEPVRQLLNADGFDRPELSHFDQLRDLVEAARRSASPGAEA